MAIQLVAGQSFASDYSLLNQLDHSNDWLALYEPTQERVTLRLLANADVQQTDLNADRLVHPNLLRTLRIAEHEGQAFAVIEYKKGLTPLDLSKPFKENWGLLRTLLEALEYAHSLGFHHGNLSPQCLWVDGANTAYLGGFGLPTVGSQFLSPEQQQNQAASKASDIYSFGQLLHMSLTGQTRSETSQVPLDAGIDPLLRAMLSTNPADRPGDFGGLISLLEEGVQDSNQSLSAATFTPAQTTPTASNTATDTQAHRLPRERQVVSLPLALLGFGLIVLLAGGLFLLLPDSDVARPTATVTVPEPTSTPVQAPVTTVPVEEAAPVELAPLELAKLAELKETGKQLAAELLRLQVEVEDVGGRLWAGTRYDESSDLGIQGDDLYRQEQYQAAVDSYQTGIDRLKEVLAETESVFEVQLEAGVAAFQNEDPTGALEAYKILTRIEPGDQELRAQLNRAENFEQVLRLTADAEIMERNGNLADARDTFQQAADLDAAWAPASDGVTRIDTLLARKRFQDRMSNGFKALSEEDFEVARSEFEAAQKILPTSSEPLDGLQQIELAKAQKALNDLFAVAQAAESEGRWQDAVTSYESILESSPGLTRATRQLENAKTRAALKVTLEKYSSQPQLMQNDEDLSNAKTALREAARLGDESLKDLVNNLSHYVSLARIKVPVSLRSNGRTDVTVYKVGEFGKIDRVQLSLIPGVYTFVGKRNGYRDVFEEVHIKGDVPAVDLTISCTEKI